ncbi:hypothetical protein H4Q26_017293 [Puccinia striiformis f. sp. tritici PST-130]|nr:hypothetical protein H4Q26_017293 [Puccinia striiformis f. sp. tritici PST-130]
MSRGTDSLERGFSHGKEVMGNREDPDSPWEVPARLMPARIASDDRVVWRMRLREGDDAFIFDRGHRMVVALTELGTTASGHHCLLSDRHMLRGIRHA